MEGLEPLLEHGAVLVVQEPGRELDRQVGADTEQVRVERAVVDGAERQSVGDLRHAALVAVGDDVRCLQQAGLVKAADRAALPLGRQHDPAELLLVQALADGAHDVAAVDLG